jgi:polysaccharide export outer membrane protein
MAKKSTMALLMGIAWLAEGCTSFMPTAGPLADEITNKSVDSAASKSFDYTVIDITDAVCNTLALRPGASLVQTFGTGGPAPVSVIGIGDYVTVTIWEAGPGGLFSSPPTSQSIPGSRTATIPEQVVARDGTISIPYVGRIRVVGLKPSGVEQIIIRELKDKAVQPQAVVAVTRNVSNTVSVTGEVTSGARIPLTVKGDRLLDVVATAGGIRTAANETFIRLTRGDRTATVSFNVILKRPSENIYVRGGDVLTLVRRPQTFTALGATGRNALIPFEADTMTLEEAVAKAGGLLDHRADPEGVFLFRFEPAELVRAMNSRRNGRYSAGSVPVVYKLNFRDASSYFLARKFEVSDKDMIYVANAPGNELQKFLNLIGSALGPALSATSVGAQLYTTVP